MTGEAIYLEVQPLKVRLKTTFRHAAVKRNAGESVWVRVRRENISGFGEGCPRDYAAGDDTQSSIQWVQDTFSGLPLPFNSLEGLRAWLETSEDLIDRYPSAWCAVEMALLDLFSKERSLNVETLLGLATNRRQGRYSAVLGDDNLWKYTAIAEQYLVRGFSDFKIKLNGNLQRDREKITTLHELCEQHGIAQPRIRLDANNLWRGRAEEAGEYLKALKGPIFAVEEPVGPGNTSDISRVSLATGLPVILDESLCTLEDLAQFKSLPGNFIANIKISRVGGILRALRFIEKLEKLDWPIIVGCHVGETSLLTRVALIPAGVAGENLIAQEGAYGDYLVEREPVEPMLKFGRYGLLNLNVPYYSKTIHGLQCTPVENWDTGFGMDCRWPKQPDDGNPELLALTMPDQYRIHYRLWGPAKGTDVLVILHGGMSHSGWQAPLANALRAVAGDLSVVAPDRRGCGLNADHGDLGSVSLVVEDVVKQVECLKTSFKRVHLAGWCQGSQYAAIAAGQADRLLASLILLTPGFFWNERFRAVLRITESNVFNMVNKLKLKPERDQAYVPVPMEAADFTLENEWLDFIENDELKTTMITMKTAQIMDEIQELSWAAILTNRLPLLALLAENDRIVDNAKVRQFIGPMFTEESGNRLITFDSGHAIQFEMPEQIAGEIHRFILERQKDRPD
jgi:L-alanine-DL-glutamate epimerase-like enolase superfamily enzyme/pimeloyl-ACP methyl ester carboxylesterase